MPDADIDAFATALCKRYDDAYGIRLPPLERSQERLVFEIVTTLAMDIAEVAFSFMTLRTSLPSNWHCWMTWTS